MFTDENPPQDSSFPSENLQLGDDMLKSSNDDENPLPKFSIRDFVFQNRGRDLKTNWPFSQKNLQLCLNYEVEDVLPPFQPPDSLRNRANSTKIPSFDQKVTGEVETIAPLEFEDKEFPSRAARSKLFSALNSVSSIKSPEESTEFATLKKSSSIRRVGKKRRFPVPDPTTIQDSAVNSSLVSESMASQACPVCKTFSSCSNTTLNAHIDQCLSAVPISNLQACEKAAKHKIKRKRIRLITDIYETALCYTLEDLDRRNGTNWASNLSLLPEDSAAVAGEHASNINDKNGVYFDSNGIKLLILSKLDNTRLEKSNYGSEPSKLVGCESGRKPVLAKRNYLVQKRKLLHPGGYATSSFVQQIRTTRFSADVSKKDPVKPLVEDDLTRTHVLGTLKNWACSKRTSRKKKVIQDYENMDSTESSSFPSPSDEAMKRNSTSIYTPFAAMDHPLTSDSPRTASPCHSDECLEPPSMRRRVGFPCKRNEDKHSVSSWPIAKQPSKDRLSVHIEDEDFQNSSHNLFPAVKRKIKRNVSAGFKGDGKFSPLGKSLISSPGPDEEGALASRSTIHRKGMNKHEVQLEKSLSTLSVIDSNVFEFRKKRLTPISTYNGSLNHEGLKSPYNSGVNFSERKTGSSGAELPCQAIHEVAGDPSHSYRCVVAYNPSDLILGEGKMLSSESFTSNRPLLFQKDDPLEARKYSYRDAAQILIPGPPGCFSPRPDHGGSDELQENSSLTTCRLQSSDDEHKTVDTDSLHPDVSAMEAPLSTSVAVAENVPVHSHAQYPTHCSILEMIVDADKEFNRLLSHEVVECSDNHNAEDCFYSSKSRSLLDLSRNPEAQGSRLNLNLESMYPLVPSHGHSEAELSAQGSFYSSAEPPSNPFLRLMGKNLMVTSKHDNLSCPTQRSSIPEHCVGGPFNINSSTPTMRTGIHQDPSDGSALPAHFRHPMISSNHIALHGSF